jgi:hypothetical protein
MTTIRFEKPVFKIGFRFTVLYSQFAVAVSRAAIECRGPTVTENWEQWNCGRNSVVKGMIQITFLDMFIATFEANYPPVLEASAFWASGHFPKF